MAVQVLVATIDQKDYSLIENMNIQTDAIVCNQCSKNEIVELKIGEKNVYWLNFKERGVGINRNESLMRASKEYCLFADDDMVYVDGYADIVEKAFQEIPDADIIVFNLIEPVVMRYVILQKKRINRLNCLRYGTARIAIRLRAVRENGILFHQCFGGGTEHCKGEDSIFLMDCLKKGLHLYAYPAYIARLTEERESTCKSSLDKSLRDKQALYRQISRKYWRILCLQDALRHSKKYGLSWIEAYKAITQS